MFSDIIYMSTYIGGYFYDSKSKIFNESVVCASSLAHTMTAVIVVFVMKLSNYTKG